MRPHLNVEQALTCTFSDTTIQPTTLQWGWRRVARRMRTVMRKRQAASIRELILNVRFPIIPPRDGHLLSLISPEFEEPLSETQKQPMQGVGHVSHDLKPSKSEMKGPARCKPRLVQQGNVSDPWLQDGFESWTNKRRFVIWHDDLLLYHKT